MYISSFPKMDNNSRNPYLYLIKKGLLRNKINIDETNSNKLSISWLIRNRNKVKILHFHWLQYHYINISKKRISISSLINFIFCIFISKFLNYKIVWTMHNTQPHENKYPKIDSLLRKFLVKKTHSIITHCEYSRNIINRIYNRKQNIFVIPHPNYIDIYENKINKNAARSKIGIPHDYTVFVFLGEIRYYKGINQLINAFKSYKNNKSVLLIAGNPLFPEIKDELASLIGNDERIITKFQYIQDKDVQIYLNAADAVIFPFSKITMSGSLLMAMSFKKAVIAPSIGGISEYVKNNNSGILYDSAKEDLLLNALKKCEKMNLNKLGINGFNFIKKFTWNEMADKINNIYQKIITDRNEI